MCARTVRMQRKPNSVAKFNQMLANGLWEQQEHAEAYSLRHTYLAVLRALAHVMEGRPQAYPYTLRT